MANPFHMRDLLHPWNQAREAVVDANGKATFKQPEEWEHPGFNPDANDYSWDETLGSYISNDPNKQKGYGGGAYPTFGRVLAPESTADVSEGQTALPGTRQSLAALQRLVQKAQGL